MRLQGKSYVFAGVAAVLTVLSNVGCTQQTEDDSSTSAAAITEDAAREAKTVWFPVRFTRNSPEDAGHWFTQSWLPFTGVGSVTAKSQGFDWGYWGSHAGSRNIVNRHAKDDVGAGYATGWFELKVPYDTDGKLAYSLTRVKLEREFLKSEICWWHSTSYSPLRVRSGSDQPAISITMQGSLDGKFRELALPFRDEGFTERDWKTGDKDASGKEIKKVIVGTLSFVAAAWPTNVEGETNISGGVAAGNAFLMVDRSEGQGNTGMGKIHVNLVENVDGQVSVGAWFSSNGGILTDAEAGRYDAAAATVKTELGAEVERGIEAWNRAQEAQANAPIFF